MAEHDLTRTIIPYLDRHLVFPLLAWLVDNHIFPAREVQIAQYELAKGTNMHDYAVSLFQQIHPDESVPEEFAKKREEVVSTNERRQYEAQVVLNVIENPEVAQSLRQDKIQNLQYLKDNYGLTLEQITALYNFGQFQFSYGNYSGAADYLYHFRVLSTDIDRTTSAHWGKLASDILTGNWEVALEELNTLREFVDSRAASSSTPLFSTAAPATSIAISDPSLAQLHSRTWLVHWSLFVYFNHPHGRTLLLDTFMSPAYLNTIQTSCPWILRYLSAAAVLSRKASSSSQNTSGAPAVSPRVRTALREIVKVIQMEEYQYQDPVTRFLKELYVEFDFEAAQKALTEAIDVVGNDFFLGEYKDEFLDNARYLISEAYCRIHRKIDISDLSERLNLSRDEGEKWIVNLIRETRMGADAKIDLEKNVIEIYRPPQPVYQSVIEKTRGLALRTQAIGAAIARAGGPIALEHQRPPPSQEQVQEQQDVQLPATQQPVSTAA